MSVWLSRCRWREALASRLSFPARGPPDPGTDFKAPGSLTHHRFWHLLEEVFEGFLKAFWRGLEGSFGWPLQKPFRGPLQRLFQTLLGSGGSVAGMKVLKTSTLSPHLRAPNKTFPTLTPQKEIRSSADFHGIFSTFECVYVRSLAELVETKYAEPRSEKMETAIVLRLPPFPVATSWLSKWKPTCWIFQDRDIGVVSAQDCPKSILQNLWQTCAPYLWCTWIITWWEGMTARTGTMTARTGTKNVSFGMPGTQWRPNFNKCKEAMLRAARVCLPASVHACTKDAYICTYIYIFYIICWRVILWTTKRP